MSFPKYTECKDSGVEWLGKVPAHWDVRRLKYVLSQITDRASERVNPVALENIEGWSGRYIEGESDYSGGGIAFRKGDLLFGKLRPYLAKVYLPSGCGEAVGDFHVMRPSRNLSGRFAFYQLLQPQFISVVDGATHGAKMPRVGWEVMGNMPFVTPPHHEQAQIATFLDHETSRIDALVELQQRLIELLKEKRQAVISHAVTKGLDPDMPMKDSGVEWLGEVPAHWEVIPLGLLARQIQTGPFGSQLHSHEYVEGGVPVINPSSIVGGRIVPDKSSSVTRDVVERMTHQKLSQGEIVVGRRGEMGRCAVVSSAEEGWLCGTGSMKISLSNLADPEFVSMFIRTPLVRGLLQIESVGSTMDNLNPEILSRIRVPLPPIEEQHELVEKVRLSGHEAHRLVSEALQGSELLQERRSALISAAVTGKIDVRGWQVDQQTEQSEMLMAAEARATYG